VGGVDGGGAGGEGSAESGACMYAHAFPVPKECVLIKSLQRSTPARCVREHKIGYTPSANFRKHDVSRTRRGRQHECKQQEIDRRTRQPSVSVGVLRGRKAAMPLRGAANIGAVSGCRRDLEFRNFGMPLRCLACFVTLQIRTGCFSKTEIATRLAPTANLVGKLSPDAFGPSLRILAAAGICQLSGEGQSPRLLTTTPVVGFLNLDAGMPPGIPNFVFNQFGARGFASGAAALRQRAPNARSGPTAPGSSQLALALALATSGGRERHNQSTNGGDYGNSARASGAAQPNAGSGPRNRGLLSHNRKSAHDGFPTGTSCLPNGPGQFGDYDRPTAPGQPGLRLRTGLFRLRLEQNRKRIILQACPRGNPTPLKCGEPMHAA
jgi:hypothetical protein